MILVISLFVIGCQNPQVVPLDSQDSSGQKDTGAGQVKEPVEITPVPKELESSQELKKFTSTEDIKAYLDENRMQNAVFFGLGSELARSFRDDTVAFDGVAVQEAAVSAPAAQKSAGGASDFSTTNIQVENVDEADFVKNDGKYVYVLSQDKLVIVDAFPADDAQILSETEIEGRPSQLFINGDRLVVFSVADEETYAIPEYDFVPQLRYTQRTHAYVYDIRDREKPLLVNDFNVDGQFFQARMIGDIVYFIAKENVYYYNNVVDLPVVFEGDTRIASPEVFYFDNPEQNFVFHTIAAFDVNSNEINAQSYMMGHSNTLFVSENAIYIAYQKNFPYAYRQYDNKERFFEVVYPLLPLDAQQLIEKEDSWEDISSVLEDAYNAMDEKEKSVLLEKISNAAQEYDMKREIDRRKTVIHKIAIDGSELEYVAKGEVSGHLLNQFSLDEFENNLRVATTTNVWTRFENQQFSNVFVLDDSMKQIGALEGIAPDERIYSTRFIGERLYMVTFKRIDPFFVIDLSSPSEPTILGELKIPGFSDYLHPYDENHIIGIGKETEGNQWGGISVKGVKLALFDVSDVSNPRQVDKFEIGSSGTDSEALREHKAFLFDREKNLLVLPIREVKGQRVFDSLRGYYRQNIWQGAYVLGIDENGFSLRGKVSHNEGNEDSRHYWGSPYAVRRSLYMDDVLYTVSSRKILMNDLDDLDTVNSVDLPFKKEQYYPIWY